MKFRSPTPADEATRAKGAEMLQALVSNGLVLSLAAQDAHWNTKGPTFGPLHALFGEVYGAIGTIVDRLAERIVTLGGAASGLGIVGSRPGLAAVKPATQDGLAYCESLFQLVAAYAAEVRGAYMQAEELGLCANANALQDALESLEKLGWQLTAHTERG